MWRRVLLVLVAYSTIVVIGLAVPLALTVSRERVQRLGESRLAAASYFADLAARDGDLGDQDLRQAVGRYHFLYGEGVVIVDRSGAPRASAGLDSGADDVQLAVAEALRNQRSGDLPSTLTPWSQPAALVAVPVGTGTQVDGAVVLSASTAAARRDVARAWALIAAGAVALLAVASAIAVALSRWTVRPLTALSARVNSLSASVLDSAPATGTPRTSDGGAARPSTYTGPPEVRELARVFDAMADDVQTAAAAQRRLVADSAHALRNPLAALRIRLDTLGMGLSAKSLEAHRKTTAEVDRLSGIVADLLALATAEARAEEPGRAGACDVAAVLSGRYEFWSTALTDAGMAAAVAAGSRCHAAISGDDLDQILDVLLSNAVKYAGAGARVELGCASAPTGVTVWVEDSGRGVPAEDLPKIADRFFRSSNTVGQGTGLGLAIARALTERAGGTLTISARRPSGLRVELALPQGDNARSPVS